jgi:hypothetical protein
VRACVRACVHRLICARGNISALLYRATVETCARQQKQMLTEQKTRKKAATLNRYRSYTHTDCVTEEKRRCLKRAKPHTTTSTTWRMQTVLNVVAAVAAAAISSSFHLCLGASLVRSKHKLAHDISLCLSLSLTFEFRTLNPPSLVHNTNRVLLLDHPPHASKFSQQMFTTDISLSL